MFPSSSRRKSLYIYHLHMGGPDGAAAEWRSLQSSRFAPKLAQAGVRQAQTAAGADVILVTGQLTMRNLPAVLEELSKAPLPCVVVAAGNDAAGNSAWSKADMPGCEPHALSHFVDVQVVVPGDPPTPQALLAGLSAAAQALTRPGERVPPWNDEE